jgi:zinc/manganese transport system ATP-binding protein
MDALAARCARPGPGALGPFAVELDRVTLAQGDRVVLSNVSAAIRRGEFIGVFGPNGSGKTTLLRAVLGLLRPTTGQIRVLGAPPTHGNRAAGYLPQKARSTADLRLRGADFVAAAWRGDRWGLPLLGRSGRREVARVIETVEAQDLAARPLSEMSGGELQRLLLAQALLGRPQLLLLDEPLLSLDPHFQEAVVALVRRIQQAERITVLFTAHDINPLIGAMDRVLYLGQGHAVLGAVGEVIRSDVLSRLYAMPIDVIRTRDGMLCVSAHGPIEAEAHRHDA